MNGMQFRGTEWHPERLGVGEVAGKGQRAPVPTLPQTFSATWASVSLSKGLATIHLMGLAGMGFSGRKGESLMLMKVANLT